MKNLENHDNQTHINRRGFISLFGKALVGATIFSLVSTLSGCEDKNDNDKKNKEITKGIDIKKINLKKKPIHLQYNKIVEDKDLFNPFDGQSPIGKITRCLRWKPITDVVEDRYGIPRGLLMAMMAQEGMGDPTQPNEGGVDMNGNPKPGDGGLGLIHIQAANAHDFGLETLPRYTSDMIDRKHGEEILDILSKTNKNLEKLVGYDDRFHPVMAVDVAGRYLMQCKKNAEKVGLGGKDVWIHALCRHKNKKYVSYSGRYFNDYGTKVLGYWGAINSITNEGFHGDFSGSIKQTLHNAEKRNRFIKKSLDESIFKINNNQVGYQEYLAYFEESMKNFELEKYAALGDSIVSADKQYVETLPETVKENIQKPQQTKSNSLIKSEFVDTHQHNSEGFTLFRYKVKKGDNAIKISDTFDAWDKKHGNKFQNTGNRNVVNFRGEEITKFTPGNVVYIKSKI